MLGKERPKEGVLWQGRECGGSEICLDSFKILSQVVVDGGVHG